MKKIRKIPKTVAVTSRQGFACLTAIMTLIFPMDSSLYFLGPRLFWRPDVDWKHSTSACNKLAIVFIRK